MPFLATIYTKYTVENGLYTSGGDYTGQAINNIDGKWGSAGAWVSITLRKQ